MMTKINSDLLLIERRRDEIRDILFESNGVSCAQEIARIESSINGNIASYLVPTDNYVTIDYKIFANDLVKSGYGNVRDFAKEVIDMLMLFCDDDDQISLKVCELKANMQSILREFVPTFPEGTPVCKELCNEEGVNNV